MENQFVIFEIGGEYFGVNIDLVQTIIKMQSITRMPHTPVFVEGVINLRGQVLPVVDLRKRFGSTAIESNRNSRIIVTRVAGNEVGMVVDAVSEVLTLPEDAVEPPPSIATTVDSTFITGIVKQAERLIILLDLNQVLSVQEQAELIKVEEIPN